MCNTVDHLNLSRAAIEADGGATLADADEPVDTELRQPRRRVGEHVTDTRTQRKNRASLT